MVAPSPASLQIGTVFHGRYQVTRCIARGGMGAVYEVLQLETERLRALKVMLPDIAGNEELRARFRREATVGARVQSDHIVEVIDAGVDDETGAPYLVMELLEGTELAALLRERERLEPAEVALYLGQTGYALDKAHAAGVVHRDLKPENLFVTTADDGRPRLKVVDFGIAKVVRDAQTGLQTQGMLGTPMYMAPEQVAGKPITAATDLYALGLIAYTLLVGEPYWAADKSPSGLYSMLMKLAQGPEEPASARASRTRGVTLPPAFDAWFARASARDPARRFASAAEQVEGFVAAFDLAPSRLGATAMPGAPGAAPPTSSDEPASCREPTRLFTKGAGATAAEPSGGSELQLTEAPVASVAPAGEPRSRGWVALLAAAAALGVVAVALWSGGSTSEPATPPATGAEPAPIVAPAAHATSASTGEPATSATASLGAPTAVAAASQHARPTVVRPAVQATATAAPTAATPPATTTAEPTPPKPPESMFGTGWNR